MTPDALAVVLERMGALAAYRRYVARGSLITVLCLHRVSPVSSSLYPALAPALLREVCRYLNGHCRVTLFRDLDAVVRERDRKPIVVLSFDDGFRDFMEHAVPVLLGYGLRANQNVITDCAETGRPYTWMACVDYLSSRRPEELPAALQELGFSHEDTRADPEAMVAGFTRWFQEQWPDRLEGLRARLEDLRRRRPFAETPMMTWEDVREADQLGFEIGSHTVTHASLDRVSRETMRYELAHSQRRLQEVLGHPVEVLAFPGGRHDATVLEESHEVGYTRLLGTAGRLNSLLARVWSRILLHGGTPSRLRLQASGLEAALRGRPPA